MWWSVTKRQWFSHPDCTCGYRPGGPHPCYCRDLRPVDPQGKPIGPPITGVSETPGHRTEKVA